MQRLGLLGLVGIAIVALTGAGALDTGAQENADAEEAFALVSQEAATPATPAAAVTAGIRLDRLHFAPGAESALPADSAALLIVSVESGSLTMVSTAPITVNRAAGPDESAAHEDVAAGAAVSLGAGDAFVGPPDVALQLRNDGDQPAVAMTASVPTDLVRGAAHGVETTPLLQGDRGLVMALAVVVPPHCPTGYAPPAAQPAGTPGAGGGGGGSGTVAVAVAEAPVCAEGAEVDSAALAATPVP